MANLIDKDIKKEAYKRIANCYDIISILKEHKANDNLIVTINEIIIEQSLKNHI